MRLYSASKQRPLKRSGWPWRNTSSPRTVRGGYRYNHAVSFVKNIEGVLKDEHFEVVAGDMKGLVSVKDSELTEFKDTVAMTRADVKKMSRGAAALISSNAAAKIITNKDAQEEANHQNIFRLACSCAKEGMAKEITARSGITITNFMLRHLDGVRVKR